MKKKQAAAILATSVLFSAPPVPAEAATTPKTPDDKSAAKEDAKASRDAIRTKLKALADSKTPELEAEPAIAMCYAPPPPPQRQEYVCPLCGEKTLYVVTPDTKNPTTVENQLFFLTRLGAFRRQVELIRQLGVKAVLDEKAWCRKCTPAGPADLSVGLIITWPDGTRKRVANIAYNDLELLVAFMKGDKTWRAADGRKKPVKEALPRLQDLFGVAVE